MGEFYEPRVFGGVSLRKRDVSWQDLKPSGLALHDLEGAALDDFSPSLLLQALEATQGIISSVQAIQLQCLSLFVNHRPAPGEPYSRYAAAEIGAALTWSTQTAQKRLNLAHQLDTVLTRTRNAMSWGEMDLTKAQALAEIIAPLDDDKAREVEARVLPGAPDHTVRWLRDKARKAVAEVDPDGENQRRKEQTKRRRVEKQ